MAGLVVSALITGLVTGMLARFAIPGPDPMPLWLTVLVGLAGTLLEQSSPQCLLENGTIEVRSLLWQRHSANPPYNFSIKKRSRHGRVIALYGCH